MDEAKNTEKTYKSKLLPESGWQRILVAAAYFIIAAAALWIMLRYALSLFLPFVIAYITALAIGPLITLINRKTKIPRVLLSAIFVLGVTAGVLTLIILSGERLIRELTGLYETLIANADIYIDFIKQKLSVIGEALPFLSDSGGGDYIITAAADVIKNTLSAITAKLPELVGALVMRAPDAVFFIVILIMSGIYLCADFSDINAKILSRLPKFAAEPISKLRGGARETGMKYLRAYLIMMCVTFAELLCGLLILGVNYAFTAAVLIAAVDILPVFGAGTVLLPWAVIMLLRGDMYTGFGLLIIYGAITLVRQIMEPRIVGANIGLSPLASLVLIYAGYKLIGIIGMIIFPIAATIVKNMFCASAKDKKADEKKT